MTQVMVLPFSGQAAFAAGAAVGWAAAAAVVGWAAGAAALVGSAAAGLGAAGAAVGVGAAPLQATVIPATSNAAMGSRKYLAFVLTWELLSSMLRTGVRFVER